MSEEVKIKMLEVAKILFLNGVSKEQAKYIGSFIEEQNAEIEKLQNQLQQKENIKKEVREFVEKWKCVDGDGTVSFDINTNPDDLLKILDKGE